MRCFNDSLHSGFFCSNVMCTIFLNLAAVPLLSLFLFRKHVASGFNLCGTQAFSKDGGKEGRVRKTETTRRNERNETTETSETELPKLAKRNHRN